MKDGCDVKKEGDVTLARNKIRGSNGKNYIHVFRESNTIVTRVLPEEGQSEIGSKTEDSTDTEKNLITTIITDCESLRKRVGSSWQQNKSGDERGDEGWSERNDEEKKRMHRQPGREGCRRPRRTGRWKQ